MYKFHNRMQELIIILIRYEQNSNQRKAMSKTTKILSREKLKNDMQEN